MPKCGLKDAFVEEDDVEFALEVADVGEEHGEVGAIAKREDVVGALAGIGGGVDADGALRAGFDQAVEEFGAGFGFGWRRRRRGRIRRRRRVRGSGASSARRNR